MDQNSQTCIYKQQLPFPGAWEGRINKYEMQSISTYSEASKRRKCAAFVFCRALWTICFSHLSFVITWDQISPGDRALCTISLLRKKKIRAENIQTKVRCHRDAFKFPFNLQINSAMKTRGGKTAQYTRKDVNKFYLLTFGDASNCQAHGESLSQERASLWISLSHLPLENAPLVPIANIKVKHAWET